MRHKAVAGHRGIYMSDSATHGKVYEVAFRDVTGKRHFHVVGPTLKEALAEQAKINVKLGAGAKAHYAKMTFGAVAQEWYDTRLDGKAEATKHKYADTLRNHLQPAFGTRQIKSVSTDNIAVYLRRMKRLDGKAMSENSKAGVYAVLYSIMDYAANPRRAYIPVNPCDGLEAGERPRENDSPHRIITSEEAKLLLEHIDSRYRTLLKTAMLTGLRAGEILGLQWANIDFDKNEIHVVRQRLSDGSYGPTKGKAARTVPLLPTLRPDLFALPSRFQGELVFPDTSYTSASTAVQEAREAAGIEDGVKPISLHACRHTFASALLQNGKDVVWVSKLLGHKSVQTTLDTYAHVVQREDRTEEAAMRLSEALGDLG